jgi:chaperonin GroEL
MSFENVDMTILGSAKKVIINKDETIIIDGAGEKEVIKGRVD